MEKSYGLCLHPCQLARAWLLWTLMDARATNFFTCRVRSSLLSLGTNQAAKSSGNGRGQRAYPCPLSLTWMVMVLLRSLSKPPTVVSFALAQRREGARTPSSAACPFTDQLADDDVCARLTRLQARTSFTTWPSTSVSR